MEETMGHDNFAYGQPRRLPNDAGRLKVMVSPEPVLQPDVGFRNPHIDRGGHFQTLDKTNGVSDNFYPDLRFSGATKSQSAV